MKNSILVVVILCVQVIFSQKLSHPLHADSRMTEKSVATAFFPDTLKVLVLMVQFQADNDSRTSGNGEFDLTATNERIIDAPPHDSAYVADHFVFANNYFTQASNGKQHIRATVLGKTMTLKKQMKEYAPVNGNLPLGNMIEESWKAADSLYPVFPFQQYDLFAIVHAGVGRDIDLRAALGYDPTPLDIPSLYFNLNSLKTLFGNSYQGVSLTNSAFKIPNTVVLPETEVRRIPSIGEDIILKLGINGLIVASIGSHLGLPDLFDTKTGKSAIGRFGLMDGQSIFSFLGIAPPEPSAWEKIHLGWTTPIEIFGTKNLRIPAVGLYTTGNDTIYKIPISAKEYFLVENRHRDAKGDGQTITMKWNGQTFPKHFLQDEDYFYTSNIDSVYGVILDVDELDWSIPGIINVNNTYSGGILIWHIDESVIEQHRATNTINADPSHRGVDLEEADGSQDIGQTYDFGDPASGSEDGSPIDYWFSGNIFPEYKNEFSEKTNPNSLSNSYARSHISLRNFSTQNPHMTFEAHVGSTDIQLVKVIKRKNLKFNNNDAPITADLNGDGRKELIYTSGDSIYVLKDDLTPYLNNTSGLFYPKGGKYQPLFVDHVNLFLGTTDSSVIAFNHSAAGIAVSDTFATISFFASVSAPLVSSSADSTILVSTSDKKISILSFKQNSFRLVKEQSYPAVVKIFSGDNLYSDNTLMRLSDTSALVDFGNKKIIAAAGGTFGSIDFSHIVIFDDNTFQILPYYFKQDKSFGVTISGSLALSDLDNDGELDIILGSSKGLFSIHKNGVLLDHFPLRTLDDGEIVGSPIVVKRTGSSENVTIFGTSTGQLNAYSSRGNIIEGFPLQTGGIVSSPVLWGNKLVVASSDSSIYIWNVGTLFDTSKVLWGNFLGDENHSNFVSLNGTVLQKSTELLPKKFAYNWPNPVYSGSTHIRYYLGKPAIVTIKIVNLAGELVEELRGTNYVGLDNEVDWNITSIQSGIYFAQITASGSGEEANQIVKIAVVK